MKLKTKTKRFLNKKRKEITIIYSLIIGMLVIGYYGQKTNSEIQRLNSKDNFVSTRIVKTIEPAKDEDDSRVDQIKEYVKREAEKAGLKWSDVECLINHESGWNQHSYYVNKDKSVDRGLWMWNDKWNKHISNDCSFDYKCSTIEAIIKIKKDGGYGAWYGFNKCKL